MECPSNVPIKEDSGNVSVQDLVGEANAHGESEAFCLGLGDQLSMRSRMKRTNGERSGGWRREDEALLQDEVGSEWDDEEYTKVSA